MPDEKKSPPLTPEELAKAMLKLPPGHKWKYEGKRGGHQQEKGNEH